MSPSEDKQLIRWRERSQALVQWLLFGYPVAAAVFAWVWVKPRALVIAQSLEPPSQLDAQVLAMIAAGLAALLAFLPVWIIIAYIYYAAFPLPGDKGRLFFRTR